MSYTALEKMRELNRTRFGSDVGPFPPARHFGDGFGLKDAALRFIHERCEGLRFDPSRTRAEAESGEYCGCAFRPNQIPYNMEMDIDRLCLERELERFLDSGAAFDAYNVCYCCLKMFFGDCGRLRDMVARLSEFAPDGSLLPTEQGEHYSRSAYIFALGLADYETNAADRASFKQLCGYETDEENRRQDHAAASMFLGVWGLYSLFCEFGGAQFPTGLKGKPVDPDALGSLMDQLRKSALRRYREQFADAHGANSREKDADPIPCSFRHLYDFAAALSAQYRDECAGDEQAQRAFEELSLEHQLACIHRVESFGRYLRTIGCFCTDKPVNDEPLRFFTPEQAAVLGSMEHERWVREHISMGWSAGDLYRTAPLPANERFLGDSSGYAYRRAYREQLRMHRYAMNGDPSFEEIREHYLSLPADEQGKDWEPFNNLLDLIRKYDGLRIYQLG